MDEMGLAAIEPMIYRGRRGERFQSLAFEPMNQAYRKAREWPRHRHFIGGKTRTLPRCSVEMPLPRSVQIAWRL